MFKHTMTVMVIMTIFLFGCIGTTSENKNVSTAPIHPLPIINTTHTAGAVGGSITPGLPPARSTTRITLPRANTTQRIIPSRNTTHITSPPAVTPPRVNVSTPKNVPNRISTRNNDTINNDTIRNRPNRNTTRVR